LSNNKLYMFRAHFIHNKHNLFYEKKNVAYESSTMVQSQGGPKLG